MKAIVFMILIYHIAISTSPYLQNNVSCKLASNANCQVFRLKAYQFEYTNVSIYGRV